MLDGSDMPGYVADPVLLGQAYGLIGEDGKTVEFLERVALRYGCASVRLLRVGRGSETELAVFGLPEADEVRVDCETGIEGRHLTLAVSFPHHTVVSDVSFLRDLVGHIDRALSLSEQVEALRIERAIDSQLLKNMAVGTVFIDHNRQIVAMTGMAEAIVTSGDGLRIRAGHLAATNSADDRIFQEEIRSVLAGDKSQSGDVLKLQLSQSCRNIGVVVQPVETGNHPGGIACAIVIRDGARMCEPEVGMLRRFFDLTAAEAMLTRNLAGGLTLDEAAEILDIRRNTARAHLRSIFSKCGVKRQTELMRLVLASVAMLGVSQTALVHGRTANNTKGYGEALM